MSQSKIPQVVQTERAALLEDWLREQLTAGTQRFDLLSEQDLRADSDRFLTALGGSLKNGGLDKIDAPEFAPALEVLGEISRARSRLGFSPSETATFVFSLKQPLFAALRKVHRDDLESFAEDDVALDFPAGSTGAYTTEMHQRAREEVIRRQQEEMLELSTPVVKMWDGVVALPLIGTLDSARTQRGHGIAAAARSSRRARRSRSSTSPACRRWIRWSRSIC